MKMKFKSTTLNPKALLYKRYTSIEKSFSPETVYKTSDDKLWFFDKEALQFIQVPPSDIDFVEYVKSNGTNFVETDYEINQNTVVEMTASNIVPAGKDEETHLFGSSNFYILKPDYLRTRFILGTGTYSDTRGEQSAMICYYGEKNNIGTRFTFNPDDRKYTLKYGQTGLDVSDGTTTNHFDFYSTFPTIMSSPQPKALIFGVSHGDWETYRPNRKFSAITLYELKIYENDVLVRHFLPFVDKVTGEAGLYEAIKGNKFFSTYNTCTNQRSPLSAEGASKVDVLIAPKKANIVEVSSSNFLKFEDYMFQYVRITTENAVWVRFPYNGVTQEQTNLNLVNVNYSNIAKYQKNKYFFAGSFDWVMNGSESGTTGQYIKGNIMPLKSFNIKYFTDDLEICEDDLVVIDGRLYSVENPEITHKHAPKHFNIYFATLNSIL
jgi:hypothetical protein